MKDKWQATEMKYLGGVTEIRGGTMSIEEDIESEGTSIKNNRKRKTNMERCGEQSLNLHGTFGVQQK